MQQDTPQVPNSSWSEQWLQLLPSHQSSSDRAQESNFAWAGTECKLLPWLIRKLPTVPFYSISSSRDNYEYRPPALWDD